MEPLTIKCYVDKRASSSRERLTKVISEFKNLYPTRFIIERIDGRKLEWQDRGERRYLSNATVSPYAQETYKQHKEKVDGILFFIDDDNWDDAPFKRINGFMLGQRFNSYRVGAVKYRRYYEGTTEHEILHFIDEFVKFYTGVRLEAVLGVKDFDDDIVHSQLYWKKLRYNYDEVWSKIGTYLDLAIKRRRGIIKAQLSWSELNARLERLKQKTQAKDIPISEKEAYSSEFEKAVQIILKNEGGYVDHPNDPGGETKYGISKRAYPDLDIKNLTEDLAIDIYYKDYWLPSRCDKMKYREALIVFDMSVNHGISRSIKILQEALGGIVVDGIIGPQTLGALEKADDKLFLTLSNIRLRFYQSLSTWGTFGKGWQNRVFDLLEHIIS